MRPDTVLVQLLSKPDSTLWISIGSMIVALAAVIVGPIVSWKVARSQVKSNSRQAWIDTVRSKIARCMLLCSNVQKSVQADTKPSEENIEELLLLRLELELYLNPKKDVQKNILDDLREIYTASRTKDFPAYAKLLAQLGADSQILVTEVWSKIKDGN